MVTDTFELRYLIDVTVYRLQIMTSKNICDPKDLLKREDKYNRIAINKSE